MFFCGWWVFQKWICRFNLIVLKKKSVKKNNKNTLGGKTVCRSRVVRWTFPRSSSISRCPDVRRTTFDASSSTAHLVLGFIEGLCDRDILSYKTSNFYMFKPVSVEPDIIGVVSIAAWHPAICFHLLSVLNTVWRPCRISRLITPVSVRQRYLVSEVRTFRSDITSTLLPGHSLNKLTQPLGFIGL